jgi:hypothetical protein
MAPAAAALLHAVHLHVVHVLPKRVVHVPVLVPAFAFISRPHSSVLLRIESTCSAIPVCLMDTTGWHVETGLMNCAIV